MKKSILMLSCVAMLLLGGCGKDNSKDNPTICPDPVMSTTWAMLVEAYPFLSAFPEFHGDIENLQYKEIGSDLKTVTFFDYSCSESVATTYYSALSAAGFANNEGTNTYRKSNDKTTYSFSGGYSGGNFALSFAEDKN